MLVSKIRIINVYAPNEPCERRQFVESLQHHFITSCEIVMGGDFNCFKNIYLDKMGVNISRGTYGADKLSKYKSDV